MPFAMNEATRFINPTKALEYMATGRPIISTPVRDVVRQFSDVVLIGSDHDAFIDACRRAGEHPDLARVQRGLALARQNSWESIVSQLERHIEDTLATKLSLQTNAA